jgi:hypothetical protein
MFFCWIKSFAPLNSESAPLNSESEDRFNEPGQLPLLSFCENGIQRYLKKNGKENECRHGFFKWM